MSRPKTGQSDKVASVWMSKAMYTAILALASIEDVPVSEWIRTAVQQRLDNEENK